MISLIYLLDSYYVYCSNATILKLCTYISKCIWYGCFAKFLCKSVVTSILHTYYAGSVGSKNQYIHVPATAKLNIPFCKKSHDMLMKCLFILCYTMYPVNSIQDWNFRLPMDNKCTMKEFVLKHRKIMQYSISIHNYPPFFQKFSDQGTFQRI